MNLAIILSFWAVVLTCASAAPFLSQTLGHSIPLAVRAGSAEPTAPDPNATVTTETQPSPSIPIEKTVPSVDALEGKNETSLVTPVNYNFGPNAPAPGFIRSKYPNIPYYRIPDCLRNLRCATIPLWILLFCQHNNGLGVASLFLFNSFLGWADVHLARLWDIATPQGLVVDTIANKIMLFTVLVSLTDRFGMKVAIPTILRMGHEIILTSSTTRTSIQESIPKPLSSYKNSAFLITTATVLSLTVLLLIPNKNESGFVRHFFHPGLTMLYTSTISKLATENEFVREFVLGIIVRLGKEKDEAINFIEESNASQPKL